MAKCTDKELIKWFEKLYKEKAIYVWGSDCQLVTKEHMNKLYNTFKSKTYDYNYYMEIGRASCRERV